MIHFADEVFTLDMYDVVYKTRLLTTHYVGVAYLPFLKEPNYKCQSQKVIQVTMYTFSQPRTTQEALCCGGYIIITKVLCLNRNCEDYIYMEW